MQEDMQQRIEEERRLGGIEAGINSVRQSVDSLTGKIGETLAKTDSNTSQIGELATQLTLHLEEVKNRRAWERLDTIEGNVEALLKTQEIKEVTAKLTSKHVALLGTLLTIMAGVGAGVAQVIANLV